MARTKQTARKRPACRCSSYSLGSPPPPVARRRPNEGTSANSGPNPPPQPRLPPPRPRHRRSARDPVDELLSPARDAIDALFRPSRTAAGWPKFEPKRSWEAVGNEDALYVRIPAAAAAAGRPGSAAAGLDVGGEGGGGGDECRVAFVFRDQAERPAAPCSFPIGCPPHRPRGAERPERATATRFIFAELTRETLIFPFQSLVLERHDGGGGARGSPPRRIVGYDAVLDALGLYERERITIEEQDALLGRWRRQCWYDVMRISPSCVPGGFKLFWSVLPDTMIEPGAETLHFIVPPEWSESVDSPDDVGGDVWFPRPMGSPPTAWEGEPPRFLYMPDVLLRVLSFLAPHEMFYMRQTCREILKIFRSCEAAVADLRLQSVFSYFSILQDTAQEVERLVEGGWVTFADFLVHVAVHLDKVYHNVVPPLLHRAILAEMALSSMFDGKIPGALPLSGPFESTFREAFENPEFVFDPKEYYLPNGRPISKVKPSFERCFSKIGHTIDPDGLHYKNALLPNVGTEEGLYEYYKDGTIPGNEQLIKRRLRENAEATAKITEQGQLNPFARERTKAGLSALLWIFTYTDTEHRHFAGLGIGPNMEQMVYELTPETLSGTFLAWCRGLVDIFVNYPLLDDFSFEWMEDMEGHDGPFDELAIARAMWCKAHAVPPFDSDHDKIDWEDLIPTAGDVVAARRRSNLCMGGVIPSTCPEWFVAYARYLLKARRADAADFGSKEIM